MAENGDNRFDPETWPDAPVAVSPVEGIIESFWNSGLDAPVRWSCEGGEITKFWDACCFDIKLHEGSGNGRITRAYDLDIEFYQRLRVRVRPGAGITTTVSAEVDGETVEIVSHTAEDHGAVEIAGDISGHRLTRIDISFEVRREAAHAVFVNDTGYDEAKHAVQLRWIMLECDGERWMPPENPFEGYLSDDVPDRFEPGLGLLFGRDELEAMRSYVRNPLFGALWDEDLRLAREQVAVDPVTMLRQYALYAPDRYGRPWDESVDTGIDGLLPALVGLITRNERYMRQAARHVLVLANIDEWAEGFVDRMPGYFWYHSNFAPNVVTIKASLLLDWTWNWLTPAGRHFVRNAIRTKGLDMLAGAETRMANQGVRFIKGLVLGNLAIAEDRTSSGTRGIIRDLIEKLNVKLGTISRPDGTFSEGFGYGTGTMASVPITCLAASRCLEVPVGELTSPLFLRAMRFVLIAKNTIAPGFAAFCAGPLGDRLFAEYCAPTSVMASYSGSRAEATRGNSSEYVFYGLVPVWCMPTVETQTAPSAVASVSRNRSFPGLPVFSHFPDGGWVYMGNETPEAPRISFEGGMWDGHGHSWYHKHAVTVDAWGEPILITRHHLSYADARSRSTMSTRLYNTFSPSGRDQDASGTPGCGAVLSTSRDLGPLSIVESDNATAWKRNVVRGIRRVLFVRPSILIVDDLLELENPEPGVLSWNSFSPWNLGASSDDNGPGFRMTNTAIHIGTTGARVSVFHPPSADIATGQASVHRENDLEVPVFRLGVKTPEGVTHRVITLIEIMTPMDEGPGPYVTVVDATIPCIEISHRERIARVSTPGIEPGLLWGCISNGSLTAVVMKGATLELAVSFGATSLETQIGHVRGEGFLTVGRRE